MGKYEYKTSFEEAIKQGIDENEYARESSKNCILTWIANELAEANRLKRLELKEKYTHVDPNEGSYCSIEKELVDQA